MEKIHQKNVPFEEIYDLFAIRIILDSEQENEKSECWRCLFHRYRFVSTESDRLRLILTPKANGYESLYTKSYESYREMGGGAIRTTRMDDIAERGYAAHWKYKDSNQTESGLDIWLNRIREVLDNPSSNALDFIDEFK